MELISLGVTEDIESGEETINVVILIDGETKSFAVDSNHPGHKGVKEAVDIFRSGGVSTENLAKLIVNYLDLETVVEEKIEKITRLAGLDGRLSIQGGKILIDHDTVDPVLEAHIIRLLEDDNSPKNMSNWVAFLKFVEKLYGNQSEFVRKQLFGWIQYENANGTGITLTTDGDLIGYKGCAGTVDEPISINSGRAIVDGENMVGQIPNNLGSIVEMPRSQVQDDPSIGCATGLHVGTYNYASGWARGVLLTVKVNPRDIVSVPTECKAQKIRTCRYEVLEVVEGPMNELSYGDFEYDECDEEYDEEYDEEDYCDCEGCNEDRDYEEYRETSDRDEAMEDYLKEFLGYDISVDMKDVKEMEEKIKDKLAPVKEQIKDTSDKISEYFSNLVESYYEDEEKSEAAEEDSVEYENLFDNLLNSFEEMLKDSFEEADESIEEEEEDLVDDAPNSYKDFQEKLEKNLNEGFEKLEKLAYEVKDRATPWVDTAIDNAKPMAKNVQSHVDNFTAKLKEAVSQYELSLGYSEEEEFVDAFEPYVISEMIKDVVSVSLTMKDDSVLDCIIMEEVADNYLVVYDYERDGEYQSVRKSDVKSVVFK